MKGKYLVAVVGGACAGSEIASQLNDLGVEVVVFEQNPLPYGKIEDGLPRWHEKLQKKEMGKIDEKLAQPGIHYVPLCALGEGVSLDDLIEQWRLPMVILATGAWRDRVLQVPGLEDVTDDSFVYQNPFVYWFNHFHEAHYKGKQFSIPNGPIVIGGGLASIDVAKICQFQLIAQALAKRGKTVSILDLEHYGYEKVLAGLGESYEDLGIKPARLFYRKRVEDMPLVPLPDDVSDEKLEKAKKLRQKLVDNGHKRYGFEVVPLHMPVQVRSQGGTLKSVTFQVNKEQNGRFVDSGERVEVETSMMISSIGSIPAILPGIEMEGELYRVADHYTGQLAGKPGVFCVGNAITGRGNIRESAKNARRLGETIKAGLTGEGLDYERFFQRQAALAKGHVEKLMVYLREQKPMDSDHISDLHKRIAQMQQARGYNGNYEAWREQILAQR